MESHKGSPEMYEAKKFLEQAKKDVWACFERRADSTKRYPIEGQLKAGIQKTFNEIIIEPEQIKKAETVWIDGTAEKIELCHTKYKAIFPPLNIEKWNALAIKDWHPLIWAASHRCKAKPGDVEWSNREDGTFRVSSTTVFEDQMKIDTLGLMGELFLCKLFEWDFEEFWNYFCANAGKGDEDWDILIKFQWPTRYYVDSKVRVQVDGSSWNVGDGKLRSKLIAPIEQHEENGKYIFEFSRLIDVESLWDTLMENGYSPVLLPDKKKPHTRYFFESCITYDKGLTCAPEVLKRWNLLAFKCMDETSLKESTKRIIIDA